MRYDLICLLSLVLAGCGTAPLSPVAAITAQPSPVRPQAELTSIAGAAQLFCGVPAAAGPLTVALISAIDPAAGPVAVTSKAAVDAACALAGGIAVAPPLTAQALPIVAIPGPVALAVP